jgi:hypothetical protein
MLLKYTELVAMELLVFLQEAVAVEAVVVM